MVGAGLDPKAEPRPVVKQRRTVWAVVPVKRFDLAKGRLADALADDERRQLARAMLEDVLDALAATPEVDRVLVVTREPEVAALAMAAGAATVAETGQGLNAAVKTGAEAARAGEAQALPLLVGVMVIYRSRAPKTSPRCSRCTTTPPPSPSPPTTCATEAIAWRPLRRT